MSQFLGLMKFLETCPQLEGSTFNFDYFGATPVQYALTIPPNTPEISRDTLGDARSILNFYLLAVNPWGADTFGNIDNLDFFQKVKKWFEKQNRAKNFPVMGSDKMVSGVYATTDGYIEATTGSVGRYQIQCKVEYVQLNTNPNKAPLRF